jgi:tryptophan synthase alpha chain
VTQLAEHLEKRRAGGHKLLVPYVMAGHPDRDRWPKALAAVAGVADAVEVGLPYSDPLMDGPVIAEAARRALEAGVNPATGLELVAQPAPVPKIAMTYYNPVHRLGEREFCARALEAGVGGLIVPDLPLEESRSLRASAAAAGLAWIPLVAPTTSADRAAALAATATGFVYAVSTLGVTGARRSLSERAGAVAAACRQATDLPVLVGIGVSTPDQARAAAEVSDGVVVGSAVVERLSSGGPDAAASWLASVRSALDRAGGRSMWSRSSSE